RDCASKNRINIVLRDMIRNGQVRGPNVLACGFGVAATGGHETHRYQGAVEADGPDEIRKAVRMEIKHGADFIKFMASGGLGGMPEHEDPDWVEMGEDELAAGIREAHDRGRRTTVHAMGTAAIHNALNAGVDCIEHGVCLDEAALSLMQARGVHYVPTLSGIEAVARREEERGDPALGALIRRRVVVPHRESVRQAAARGIRIGCGTDTFGDVVEELCLLQDCGLSAMDCLRAATGTAAEICGLDDRLGRLASGKKADLLVVNGNPLTDLRILRSIRLVIKDGMIADPEWAMNLAN
ncbi:MAG: amidohydrolase family protein, partial [Bacillota bacterium]|nr:amidohydrolase family protein [Bacillota bacterium]